MHIFTSDISKRGHPVHKVIVVSNIKFENQANVSNSASGSFITKLPSWKFLDSQYTAA